MDSPWNSPDQNTVWVAVPFSRGSSQLRDWTQVSLVAGRLYQLNHQGSPRILEWVAYLFSSGSSWPRNRSGVSCIAGSFFTNWAIREAQCILSVYDVITHGWKRVFTNKSHDLPIFGMSIVSRTHLSIMGLQSFDVKCRGNLLTQVYHKLAKCVVEIVNRGQVSS